MDWGQCRAAVGQPGKARDENSGGPDPFEDVAQEAADWGAELIVTHHPPFFRPARNLTDETGWAARPCCWPPMASAPSTLTPIWTATDGVNDVLARTLGLENIRIITLRVTEDGREWGAFRMGTVPEQSLDAFLSTVKTALHCPGLRYAQGGKKRPPGGGRRSLCR